MPEGAITRTYPYEETRPNIQNIQQVPAQILTAVPEDPRAHAREVPLYEQSVPNMDTTWPQQVSRGNSQTVSADSSDATFSDLHKIVHAPEGVLPSDLVKHPTMRSDGSASYVTMLVVMLALMLADVVACFRSVFNAFATLCGKAPQRCQKACRLIVNQQLRTTCGNPCCLPEDHGPVWNHSCPEHVQLGGRVSSLEHKTFLVFQWWQRVLAAVSSVCHMVTWTVWKWS